MLVVGKKKFRPPAVDPPGRPADVAPSPPAPVLPQPAPDQSGLHDELLRRVDAAMNRPQQAPVVNIPPHEPPTIHVNPSSPTVHVVPGEAPVVNIQAPEVKFCDDRPKPKGFKVTRDNAGKISYIEVEYFDAPLTPTPNEL